MSHGHGSVDYVRKFFVLLCLFGSLLGLYYIAPNSDQGVGLLALGFVILSAFLIGQVVEITGHHIYRHLFMVLDLP